ncbi:hypothetical protein EMIT0180MI3_80005 [Priestia megaterium]
MNLSELLLSYTTSKSFSMNNFSVEMFSLEKRLTYCLHWNNYK